MSALGLATIAAPLSGVIIGQPAKASLNEISTAPVAAPAFPLREHVPNAVEDLRLVTDDTAIASIPANLAAPRSLLVTRPSRGKERAVLPGCFGETPMVKYANGQMPDSSLCTLWDKENQLRPDAAVSLAKLNVAYKQEFGTDLCLSDSYRSLSDQYRVKAQRGGYAATPGTSVHGLGRAVDLCGGSQVAGTKTQRWLMANGWRYGWSNPDWALPGGSGAYEPWHWEYHAGEETGDYSGD